MNTGFFYTILSSRLGLRFAPYNQKLPNIGVEEGGTAIINSLHASDQDHEVLKINFPKPETLQDQSYIDDVLRIYVQAATSLLQKWDKKSTLISLGGDHSIAFISILAVIEAYGSQNVGLIMFDSHADLHLSETSPSGNFHGMWLRPLVDNFSTHEIGNKKINPSRVCFVGNLQLEDEEKEFIRSYGIPTYSSAVVSPSIAEKLLVWAQKFAHLHISFDIDIFSQELVSATGTPNPHGFKEQDVFTMLEVLKNHSSISLDIVEFNPKKKGAQQSLRLIKKVHASLFE